MRRRRPRKLINLTKSREGVWRFQHTSSDGDRVRISLGTRDQAEAMRMRDEILSGTGNLVKPKVGAPMRFAEIAQLYLDYDPRSKALAATTRHDRELLLKPHGRILCYFGDRTLDEITPELLERYWTEEVLEAKDTDGNPKPRRPNTGKQDLAAIAAVLRYARKAKRMTADPVAAFTAELSDASTKGARAERDPERDIRPISVRALPALVYEARKESLRDLVYVLLMVDAGLRSGECLGLRWAHIAWGTDADRNSRTLWIEENRPRGMAPETPKSGRRRSVGMSCRLRAALLEYRRERWNPSPEEHVLQGVDHYNWPKREWRRVTARAGIVARRKDLRDTFASVLLSSGVPIVHISKQLGHATIAMTLKSYAKWCHGDDYVDPVRLSPSQLPADLLAGDFDQILTRRASEGTDLVDGDLR